MKIGKKKVKRMAVATMVIACVLPVSAWSDDQDVIDYRQHIMKTLHEQTAAIGLILSMSIPNDNVVSHLEIIAVTASTALKAFEPEVAGGAANATVWSNWADFSMRMNELAAKAAHAAKVAKERGVDGATVIDALDCKGCHKVYRAEWR